VSTVGVAAPLTPGLYYNPVVTVTNGSEETTLINSAPLTVTAPVLSLAKVAARGVISAGESVSYTLTYSNTSSTPASGVWLTDTLPAGVTLVGSVPPTSTQVGNQAGWNLGSVGANASGTLLITVSVPAGLAITPSSTTARASPAPKAPAPAPAGAGDSGAPLSCTSPNRFSRPGPGRQPADLHPHLFQQRRCGGLRRAHHRHAGWQHRLCRRQPCPAAAQPGLLGRRNLPPDGVNHTIVVTVGVTSPLTNGALLTNTALIAAAGHSAQVTETTSVASAPILHARKTASSSLVRPATSSRTLSPTPTAATRWPTASPSPTPLTATPPSRARRPATAAVTLDYLQPASVGHHQLTLTVRVTDVLPNGTLLTNSVAIRDATGVSATDQATVTVQSAPVLHLSKTASAAIIQPGDTLTYTLWYSNTGDSLASGVLITDTLPAALHLRSAAPGASSGSDPTYVWNVGVVPVDCIRSLWWSPPTASSPTWRS